MDVFFRRGSAAEWSKHNPVLLADEIGVETGGAFKVGDGRSSWSELPYSTKLPCPAKLRPVVARRAHWDWWGQLCRWFA